MLKTSTTQTQLTKNMNINELIEAALKNPATKGITLYWDRQDSANEGPAYRTSDDSGSLELLRWEGDAAGMHLENFFRGPDGAYLGPDADGVYPVLIPA